MRAVVLLCWALVARAATTPLKCVELKGEFYDKDILAKPIDRPYQLSFHKKTNNLFFSYTIGATADDHFKSAYINVDSKQLRDITSVEDGFASAVDEVSGTVYLGGSDGIYICDEKNNTAVRSKAIGKNIWCLFYKEKLYFIEYPSQSVYAYDSNDPQMIKEFEGLGVSQFAVDAKGETFFANNTGLFGVEKGGSVTNATAYDLRVAIRGIAVNNEGKAYFCGEDGIYTLNEKKKIEHVFGISDAFGIAFDKDDHIIYANSNEIVRLKPSNKKKC